MFALLVGSPLVGILLGIKFALGMRNVSGPQRAVAGMAMSLAFTGATAALCMWGCAVLMGESSFYR